MQFENSVYSFVIELTQFDYQTKYSDHIWKIIFPDNKNKWHFLSVTKYKNTYYIGLIDKEIGVLEVIPKKSLQITQSFASSRFSHDNAAQSTIWHEIIKAAYAWLQTVKKNWITANSKVQKNYPLKYRYGYAPNSLVRASLPDLYHLDKELGKAKTKKFIQLVESGYFRDDKNSTLASMAANDFFNYCKIAYLAAQRRDENIDKNLSGREMYQRYADGRDEGLLAIAANSKKAFASWIDGTHPKKTSGGHPWEIKRGGNTTHIDLYVSRPFSYLPKEKTEGFKISLAGSAIGRLKELICMFLAIHEAKLPITVDNPEGIRKRLLAQDNIGIIPSFDSLHRANQHFDKEDDVFDVLYYDDLGKYKTRIKPFIIWEPLPILKPTKT